MDELIKVEMIIKKTDLPKLIETLGVEEYHYKKNSITIVMTRLFDAAETQYTEEGKGNSSDGVYP